MVNKQNELLFFLQKLDFVFATTTTTKDKEKQNKKNPDLTLRPPFSRLYAE